MAGASSALGIIARRGLGEVCNFDASHLWIQHAGAIAKAKSEKVAGTANPADFMIKALPLGDVEKYVGMMSAPICRRKAGRGREDCSGRCGWKI